MSKVWSLVQEKYKIGDKLGAGGQGAVFKATRRTDGRVFVVKSMKEPPSTTVQKFWFLNKKEYPTEGYILKKLPPHENLILFKGSISDPKRTVLIFDLEDGDLHGLIKGHFKYNRWMPSKFLWHLMLEGARALALIHKHDIIHRDIKPDNFLIRWPKKKSKRDCYPTIVLADFGLAADRKNKTWDPSTKWGTEGYRSPERLGPNYTADAPADVWALGACVHYAIWKYVPQPPYHEANPRTSAIPYSEKLYAAVLRTLEPKPSDRWTAEKTVARVLTYQGESHFRALMPYGDY